MWVILSTDEHPVGRQTLKRTPREALEKRLDTKKQKTTVGDFYVYRLKTPQGDLKGRGVIRNKPNKMERPEANSRFWE